MLSAGFAALVLAFPLAIAAGQAEQHLGKGYELIQAEQYEEAEKEFQAALALDPGLTRARYQRAICLFAMGRREDARPEFDRLRVETSGDAGVIYYLARLDLLDGATAAAIERLRSIAANPPFPDTAFYLGSAYLTAGNHRAAIGWLEKAAALNPRDFRARYRLARAWQLSGEPGKAEHEYTLSAQIRERYNDAARQVGECGQAIRSGADPAVQPACRSLFDANDPDKLTTLGMLYGQNGRYADAIGPLQMAARLDPDSFEVHHNLGVTYFRLKRYAEARAPLEKAVELRPDFFGSNALLGAVLFALKEDEGAYRSLEHAHQLNPADSDTAELLVKTALVLARRRHESADYAACARYLEVAARLRPADETIRKRLEETRRLAKNTRGSGDNTGSAPRRERELQ